MPRFQKLITETEWLFYHAEITDEQAAEWKAYLEDETGEIFEPDWVCDLEYDLVRTKPANSDLEGYGLIEDGAWLRSD